MKGIQLKIKGEWVALPEDFSLTLSQTNPLFNEDGAFSFPFEVPIEPNRSIFKNIADPFGDIRLEDIDGMEAELWFEGILVYKGLIETDEEIEFEDNIPMTFLSGNSDFMKRIEELNAQDIPLDREIKLGYVVTGARPKNPSLGGASGTWLPENVMMNYTNYNISDPYPIKPYCNVRVCTSDENGRYKVLDAKRPFSGVCFYVLYFLDCLFKHLRISVLKDNLYKVEDISRLAFFTTQCNHVLSESKTDIPLSVIRDENFCGKEFSLDYYETWVDKVHVGSDGYIYEAKDVFATKDNFPNILIKNIVEDLKSAFGICFIFDERTNNLKLLYVKDVFKENDVKNITLPILNYKITKSKKNNIILTYGDSDDISFNYTDYSLTKTFNGYDKILNNGIFANDKTCYIDDKTGNAYRVKVNKETGLAPSLFEVGGYRDFLIGANKNTDNAQKISINFAPIVVNDTSSVNTDTGSSNFKDQELSVFIDAELRSSSFFDEDIYTQKIGDKTFVRIHLKSKAQENFDLKESEESPLRTYDAGYTLGIMRGPGSSSKVEYISNYDEEGNSYWVQTAANYAFTSDTCDNYGRFFDYNGTEAGGADQTGRFSLKLVAGKDGFPIDSQYANRGLVSKFLSEYLYFLENRKTVILEVEMSITQLINIDFLKRYKIGDFVGFINKVSYTMTANGMEDVTIEMYTL